MWVLSSIWGLIRHLQFEFKLICSILITSDDEIKITFSTEAIPVMVETRLKFNVYLYLPLLHF